MRKARVRVEKRLDGTIAVRFRDQYVPVRRCAPPESELASPQPMPPKAPRPAPKSPPKSDWMKNFSVRSGPSLRQAIEVSNARH
jgi:hypothetical protein